MGERKKLIYRGDVDMLDKQLFCEDLETTKKTKLE